MKVVSQPEYQDSLLLPVMDSVNKPVFNSFSRLVRNLDISRAAGISDDSLSIRNSTNLCEMHYANSSVSALIQVADIASYLLHSLDFIECDLKVADFKQRVISVANGLRGVIVRNEIIKAETT